MYTQESYQSPGKRTQCAVLAFPLIHLSTSQKKNHNQLSQNNKRNPAIKFKKAAESEKHLQTFPHDEGTRRCGPQGQQIG